MPRHTLPLLLAFATWTTWSAAAEAATVALENRVLRLEIERSPAPHLGRLVHKASGQVLVERPALKSLFSLALGKSDGSNETIDAERASHSSARVDKAAGAERLVLRYENFPGLDLAVEVTAACEADSPLTLWSIAVENRTRRALRSVRFPQLVAVPTIGQGTDDCLVLPFLPGTLVRNPAENWHTGQSVSLLYPGSLSAQFLAYQDRTAGVYLAGRDTAAYPKAMSVIKLAQGLRLSHDYVAVVDGPHAPTAQRWESPYPIALGVTQGTWCDSADLYKRWAVRQPWCARTLVQRADIPAWWKQGPDVYTCEVRKYDNHRTCTGSYYPELRNHLDTWQRKIDGPVVAMLAGWENHRRWTAGDYFPVFDADRARAVIAALRQQGIRPFFYLSGMFYTYWNEGRDGSQIPAAEKHRAAYVVDARSGKPKEYVLNESSPSGDWKRHSYQFCPCVAETKKYFLGVIDQSHKLGVDVLQMDQTVCGAGDACYAPTHGHPAGPGLYQSHAFWDLLDAMREHGKRLTPDFVLFHEEPHEWLIPHLDGIHTREYMEGRWYRSAPGAVGIPLFSYLYHEYAIAYGGDSAGLSRANDRNLVRVHAVNLITGHTPGGSIWSAHQSMFEAHPDQITMLRNHCRLLKTRAQECLMLGRMLHPYELDVPDLGLTLPVRRGKQWTRQTLPTPAVLTSSWQSPAGRIGHLFVNIGEQPQPLAVSLNTRNLPPAQAYDVAVWRSSAGQTFQPLWQKASLPKPYQTELAPLEALFVELSPCPEKPQ
jgi:hypothetical protein